MGMSVCGLCTVKPRQNKTVKTNLRTEYIRTYVVWSRTVRFVARPSYSGALVNERYRYKRMPSAADLSCTGKWQEKAPGTPFYGQYTLDGASSM